MLLAESVPARGSTAGDPLLIAGLVAGVLLWAYYTGKVFGWRFWKWPW